MKEDPKMLQGKEQKYFIIDRRSFVGNDVLFWAWDSQGYTTDLRKAHQYTEAEARGIDSRRSTDCAIPVEEAFEVARPCVDMQHLDRQYFNREFSYFTKNNSKNDQENEVTNLKRKLNEFENILNDMEHMHWEYGVSAKDMIREGRKQYERVKVGKPRGGYDE